MKFIILIAASLYLFSEVLNRKIRNHFPCSHGSKTYNEACEDQFCGSQCGPDLTCQKDRENKKLVCKKEPGTSCSESDQCGEGYFCRNYRGRGNKTCMI